MDDSKILQLHRERDEKAIEEVASKYKNYLLKIAGNFLYDKGDQEECFNDVLLRFWNGPVPTRPEYLSVYLASLMRETCIDLFRKNHRKKRISSEFSISMSEIDDIVTAGNGTPESVIDKVFLASLLQQYFSERPKEVRHIFIMRYYYADSIHDISKHTGIPSPRIYTILSRERKRLKKYLLEKGYLV